MTLDQLEILDAIVDTGSFRAAADKLWKTQPAVSIAVKKLEKELKVELFERSHKQTILTPAGKRIFSEAQKILKGTERLNDLSKYLSSKNEPVLRLVVDIVSPLHQLLPSLKSFFNQHKKTQLDLSFEVLGGVVEKLEREEADLAISNLNSSNTSFERQSIWKVEMIPVCAPDYIKTSPSGFIEDEKLRNFTQIVVSETSKERNSNIGVLEGANQWHVSSLEIKYELLLAGMGWGSLPLYKVKNNIESGKLIRLKSKSVKPIIVPFYVCRIQNKYHGTVASQLWEHFKTLNSK